MLVPALFTGCIKEDMDDCMNVAVCFQYNADGQDNVLQNYIHDINLYTFTTNGSIHSRIPVGKEYLTNEKRFKQIQNSNWASYLTNTTNWSLLLYPAHLQCLYTSKRQGKHRGLIFSYFPS